MDITHTLKRLTIAVSIQNIFLLSKVQIYQSTFFTVINIEKIQENISISLFFQTQNKIVYPKGTKLQPNYFHYNLTQVLSHGEQKNLSIPKSNNDLHNLKNDSNQNFKIELSVQHAIHILVIPKVLLMCIVIKIIIH